MASALVFNFFDKNMIYNVLRIRIRLLTKNSNRRFTAAVAIFFMVQVYFLFCLSSRFLSNDFLITCDIQSAAKFITYFFEMGTFLIP